MSEPRPRTAVRKLIDRLRYQVLRIEEPGRPRVICLGMAKTGTTSFCDAMTILGYRAVHYPPVARAVDGRLEFDWPWWMNAYDAMADVQVAVMYRELHAKFPNSTFILTTRAEDRWLESCRGHFTQAKVDIRRAEASAQAQSMMDISRIIFGSSTFDEARYRETYRRHNDAVRAHFAGHPRFFEMDLTAGQGWAPLCAALGIEAPAMPFPHSNVRARETA